MAAPDSRRGSINPILELDEEPNSRSVYRIPSVKLNRFNYISRYRMQRSRGLIVLLVVLATLVVILSCVLAYVLVLTEKSRSIDSTRRKMEFSGKSGQFCDNDNDKKNFISEGVHSVSGNTSTCGNSPFCQRPGCIQMAAELLTFGDRQADPCTDFYQYACGSFHTSRPRGQVPKYDVRQMMSDYNNARLQQLLLQKSDRKLLNKNLSAVEKARLFYVACLKSQNKGFVYGSRMLRLLEQLGGIPFLHSWTPNPDWNFNAAHAEILKYHKAEMFFGIERTNKSHIKINQAKAPAYLDGNLGNSVHNETKQMYQDSLMRVFGQLLSVTWTRASGSVAKIKCNSMCLESLINDALSFSELVHRNSVDTDLYMLSWGRRTTPQQFPLSMSLTELQRTYRNFNWTLLFTSIYGTTVQLTSLKITVPSRHYMQNINDLVGNQIPLRLQRYMVSRLLISYISVEDAKFSQRRKNLDLQWKWEDVSHTSDCLALLQTNLPRAVQGVFIHNHIGYKRLNSVKSFVAAVKKSLSANLGWIGEPSRNHIESQLARLHVQFGALDSVVNEEVLNRYYRSLVITPDDTLQNMLNINRFKADLLAAGNVNKVKLWQIRYPDNLHLLYVSETSKLVIPYGALQVPWYHEHVPAAYNAATIGGQVFRVLADEFVPFVDTSIYQSRGNDRHIWDKRSLNATMRYFNCVEASGFSSRSLADSPTRRNRPKTNYFTQQELNKISRVLSQRFELSMARHLYDELLESGNHKNRAEALLKLPGTDNLTANQLFYTLFVQSRCQTEELVNVKSFDLPNHVDSSTMPLRQTVNEMLFGDKKFREAFSCKSDSTAPSCHLF